MGFDLASTLSWWQWLVVAAVPPAIVALYFLKLRRRPIEVPSTYLWRKSIEDLHVNALWQRLRRNILLWLQLAVVALSVLALARPAWQGMRLSGDRFIFLVDNSASMQATDLGRSRLEEAKRRAGELVDQMGDSPAMILSFSDTVSVEQTFTRNRRELHRAIDSDAGPLLAVAPREGFEDAVLGFALTRQEAGKEDVYYNTNWPAQSSFPIFTLNLLRYLGGAGQSVGSMSLRPGQPATLRTGSTGDKLEVRSPAGQVVTLAPSRPGQFHFTSTEDLGPYRVMEKGGRQQWFAVNLFDRRESDIRPPADQAIRIGYMEVKAKPGWEAARREIWKLLVLAGLVVLLGEWYTYYHRVAL